MEQISQNIKATKEMCAFCFDTLIAKLNKQQLSKLSKDYAEITCPIFVTWNLDSELRGCIGTFSPQPLNKILGKYALISALQDDRFPPIQKSEFQKLSVCVSLLVNFKSNQGLYDWEIGRHGIILKLKRNGKNYQSTYLPQVAKQWQWNHDETLKSLLEKAGYQGPLNLVKDQIKLTTYESSAMQISHKEYLQMKNFEEKAQKKE